MSLYIWLGCTFRTVYGYQRKNRQTIYCSKNYVLTVVCNLLQSVCSPVLRFVSSFSTIIKAFSMFHATFNIMINPG